MRRKVSPETLQSFGVLALGLGFMLIGLGGFTTYHAAQKLQHAAELREVEEKAKLNTQILTLLMKNRELQDQDLQRRAPWQEPTPSPQPGSPPPAAYQRPAPPAPSGYAPAAAEEPGRTETASATPVADLPGAPRISSPPAAPAGLLPIAEGPEGAKTNSPSPAPEPTPLPTWAALDLPRAPARKEPESALPEMPMRFVSNRQQHEIAKSLRAQGPHVVTIESSYGDPASREFARELAAAFGEAEWTVKGIQEHRGLPLSSGVTISAASFPPQPETRVVYETLLSAGIAVTQQLDPKQHQSETVVLVGTPL